MRFPLSPPLKGIVEGPSRNLIPAGFAGRALNVVPFDSLEDRLRIGKRPGLKRLVENPVDGVGVPIFRMRQVALASAGFINPDGFFSDPLAGSEGWEAPPPPPPPQFPFEDLFDYPPGETLISVTPVSSFWDWIVPTGAPRLLEVTSIGNSIWSPSTDFTSDSHFAIFNPDTPPAWDITGKVSVMEVDITWQSLPTNEETSVGMAALPTFVAIDTRNSRQTTLFLQTFASSILLRWNVGSGSSEISETVSGSDIFAKMVNPFSGKLVQRENHVTGLIEVFFFEDGVPDPLVSGSFMSSPRDTIPDTLISSGPFAGKQAVWIESGDADGAGTELETVIITGVRMFLEDAP